MDGVWVQLVLVAVLVILNGMFAGSELAMIALRPTQIEAMEERGATGRAVARLSREPNRMLATIQVGITLAAMLASATAAVTLSEPVADWLAPLGRWAQPVALLLVTAALAFISLVFGELAPKRLALQRPEAWSLVAARPLEVLATVTRPIVWLLGVSTNLVVRLFGGDPEPGAPRRDGGGGAPDRSPRIAPSPPSNAPSSPAPSNRPRSSSAT